MDRPAAIEKSKRKAKKSLRIIWSKMSEFSGELYESVNDDSVKKDESITSLTDPLNNSICEKCAAIKMAFMLKVHDNVARNYYITGMQGGEKEQLQ